MHATELGRRDVTSPVVACNKEILLVGATVQSWDEQGMLYSCIVWTLKKSSQSGSSESVLSVLEESWARTKLSKESGKRVQRKKSSITLSHAIDAQFCCAFHGTMGNKVKIMKIMFLQICGKAMTS